MIGKVDQALLMLGRIEKSDTRENSGLRGEKVKENNPQEREMSGIHSSFCFTASRILFSLKFLASFSGSHEGGRKKRKRER